MTQKAIVPTDALLAGMSQFKRPRTYDSDVVVSAAINSMVNGSKEEHWKNQLTEHCIKMGFDLSRLHHLMDRVYDTRGYILGNIQRQYGGIDIILCASVFRHGRIALDLTAPLEE